VSSFNVLVVCTANHCRSPMAAQFLRSAAQGRFGAGHWVIQSAGTDVDAGRPLHQFAEAVLVERSSFFPGHGAVALTRESILAADLILTAAREHRARVVTMAPAAVGRSFTILQFARLVNQVPTITSSDAEELGRVLVVEAKFARGTLQPIPPDEDDLPDPMGRPLPAFRECADRLQDAVGRILRPLQLSPPAG